jgi:protein-S-isoprenylcysteine O-methyltransferase Ste14
MTQAKQSRGGGWVIAQFALLALIFAAPLVERSQPPTLLAVPLGGIVSLAGVAFALLGVLQLGNNLTFFPRPLDNGALVQNGVYSVVRHPIYTGVIFASLGWSIVVWSALAFLLTCALAVLFDRKAAREETWLTEKYAEYPAYKARVKKLLPGMY